MQTSQSSLLVVIGQEFEAGEFACLGVPASEAAHSPITDFQTIIKLRVVPFAIAVHGRELSSLTVASGLLGCDEEIKPYWFPYAKYNKL